MIHLNFGKETQPLSFFTIFHFFSGVFCRIINVSFINYLILNITFEIIENLTMSNKYIQKLWIILDNILLNFLKFFYIQGKHYPYEGDSFINSFFDILFGCIGWFITDYIIRIVLTY